MDNQTISERRQLAQHLVGLDHKNNPVNHYEPSNEWCLGRLLLVSLMVLFVLKVMS